MERTLTHNGETHTLREWAKLLGIRHEAMDSRLRKFNKGMCDERALFSVGNQNIKRIPTYTYNGIENTADGWAKLLGISHATFCRRLKKASMNLLPYNLVFVNGDIRECKEFNDHIIEHNGVKKSVSGWAKVFGISDRSMSWRIRRMNEGRMTEDKCFSYGQLPQATLLIQFRGKKYTVSGLARRLGISQSTIYGRLKLIRDGLMDSERLFSKGTIPQADRKIVKNKRYVLNDGRRVSIQELADNAEVAFSTIKEKMSSGMSADDIVEWTNDTYRRVKGACWFRGKRETISDAVKEIGLTNKNVYSRINKGWKFQDAVTERKISNRESLERAYSSKQRNRRLEELKRLGITV